MLKVLGKDAKPIIDSGDPVADKNAREEFLAGYKAANSLDKSDRGQVIVLEVGEDKWPFPIPLIKKVAKLVLRQRGGRRGTHQPPRRATTSSTPSSRAWRIVDAQREYYMRNPQK